MSDQPCPAVIKKELKKKEKKKKEIKGKEPWFCSVSW